MAQNDQYRRISAILTPSDSADLAVPADALIVTGAAGTVAIQLDVGTEFTLPNTVGVVGIPITGYKVKRLMTTGTTATDIRALYYN